MMSTTPVAAMILLGLVASRMEAQGLSFEVTSVKLHNPAEKSLTYQSGPERFSMTVRPFDLIRMAYDVEIDRLLNAPEWTQNFYDIQATAGKESDKAEIKLMLQSLLGDRFGLKVHRETREMSGYVLIVDKNGPKLPPPRNDASLKDQGSIGFETGEIRAYGVTMKRLALGLAIQQKMPVVDETRIEGHYDLRLRFDDGSAADSGSTASGSIFTALREVGLRLEAKKLPVDVMLVDRIDRPTEN
jgi:uncharacterized protein (TIGR03435 family)